MKFLMNHSWCWWHYSIIYWVHLCHKEISIAILIQIIWCMIWIIHLVQL